MKICPLKNHESKITAWKYSSDVLDSRIMHAHSWRRTNEIISDTNLNYCEAQPLPALAAAPKPDLELGLKTQSSLTESFSGFFCSTVLFENEMFSLF